MKAKGTKKEKEQPQGPGARLTRSVMGFKHRSKFYTHQDIPPYRVPIRPVKANPATNPLT